MKTKTKLLLAPLAAAGLPALLAVPAGAQQAAESTQWHYRTDLGALNGSGSTGTGRLVVDESARTLRVDIEARGLVPNLPHAQHLHLGGQNVCPPPAAAGADGIIDVPEGAPSYGGIKVSLTTTGDVSASSGLAVDRMPVASADGRVTYSRTIPMDQIDGMVDTDDFVLVQHGIDTITPNGQYGPPPPVSALDPSLPLEATAPANCGAFRLTAIDLPASFDALGMPQKQVTRLYLTLLGRTPDMPGVQHWAAQLQQGTPLAQVATSIAASPEFRARFGAMEQMSDMGWVDFVYDQVFGRTPDEGGRAYWTQLLGQNRISRMQLLVLFSESPEFMALTGTR